MPLPRCDNTKWRTQSTGPLTKKFQYFWKISFRPIKVICIYVRSSVCMCVCVFEWICCKRGCGCICECVWALPSLFCSRATIVLCHVIHLKHSCARRACVVWTLFFLSIFFSFVRSFFSLPFLADGNSVLARCCVLFFKFCSFCFHSIPSLMLVLCSGTHLLCDLPSATVM